MEAFSYKGISAGKYVEGDIEALNSVFYCSVSLKVLETLAMNYDHQVDS